MRFMSELDFSLSPPENSVPIYGLISELAGCADPFANLKKESNVLALKLKPGLEKKTQTSIDPILASVKIAIAGNVIDYGSYHSFTNNNMLQNSLEQDLTVNDYDRLRKDLDKSTTILYLADNCGELIFDGILIALLTGMGKKVTLAVKEKPIINDALVSDALDCKLDRFCEVISNGTQCPGTPLEHCDEYFKKKFNQADLIISKGQGNYETLSGIPGPIYFLLAVKCPLVAECISRQAATRQHKGNISLVIGEQVLMKNVCR